MKLRVTVALFAYNHEKFIEESLRSALRQHAEPFELIIVDDASTDRTRELIEKVLAAEDLSRLDVRRHYRDRNGGLLNAFNEAMAMARGDVFVVMAGDDASLPDRVERCVALFQAHPEVMAVRGGFVKTDVEGRQIGTPQCSDRRELCSYFTGARLRIYASTSPMGAAAAYRMRLFEFFGPKQPGAHAEDNCYWVRALLLGKVCHDDRVHVRWRQHSTNASNFQADFGSEAWRRRHLAWMELHSRMSPQWLVDIRRAQDAGMISFVNAVRLRLAARREDATWGLGVSTLRPDAWRLWAKHAFRMISVGRLSSVIKMLKTRLSVSKREKLWGFWFQKRNS